MKFFKSKAEKQREKSNKRKLECIKILENLSDDAYNKRIPGIRDKIDLTKSKIDNIEFVLSNEQLDLIEERIEKIKSHMSKSYSVYISQQCIKIDDVLSGKRAAITEEEKTIESNDEKMAGMQSDIDTIFDELKEKNDQVLKIETRKEQIESEQKELINNDNKIEWKKRYYELDRLNKELNTLNVNKNSLDHRLKVAYSAFDQFVKQNAAILEAEQIKKAGEYAQIIEQQLHLIEPEIALKSAETFKDVQTKLDNNSGELDKIVEQNFGSTSNSLGDDEAETAYQKARERQYINSDNQTPLEKDKSAKRN